MSCVSAENLKVVLPRTGPDEFWQLIREHYAGEDARKWKYLAMLALRENAGWPLETIGDAFGHPKGHVTRCLAAVKSELRARFRCSPEMLDLDPELLDDGGPLDSDPGRWRLSSPDRETRRGGDTE